jgi:hypothetical protein
MGDEWSAKGVGFYTLQTRTPANRGLISANSSSPFFETQHAERKPCPDCPSIFLLNI